MPIPKNKRKLYKLVIGSCINKGGSVTKCKNRAERATKKKKRK